jgi:ubiquinone/menaquinone biosynthesis C-methylase UbiE
MGDWYQWVFQIEKFLDLGDKILEVGIGTGKLIERLDEKNYFIIGIDRSKQMLRMIRSKIQSKNMNVCKADNLFLPFREYSFDKVLATFPSEYAFKNQFLLDVKRVLKSNGELIILMGVVFTQKGMMNKLYRNVYWISGQTKSKENFETSINAIFGDQTRFEIQWMPHKNVEICFVKIKNNQIV